MEFILLLVEAVCVYGLVLGAHSLRGRFGLAHYYALIGGITAIMSWVTDAGVSVQLGGVTFFIGSSVFYTSLLLGVFVVYVFDGPRATRVAISTVVGVSIMVPLIAVALNLQMKLAGSGPLGFVPAPSLRINAASVLATLMDLVFLALAWEFMNNRWSFIHIGVRSFLTLLGVMWLDVILFNTGAFFGRPDYLQIMSGVFFSRLIISLFAAPILWVYVVWQNRSGPHRIVRRPLLALLQEMRQVKEELSSAKEEIERRKQAEAALEETKQKLIELAAIDDLTGLPNRRRFRELAAKELDRNRRYGRPLALAVIDVDDFKAINDNHGHDVGDNTLIQLARIGQSVLRTADVLARQGGDEFAVLMPETDLKAAADAAERLRQAVARAELSAGPIRFGLTISLGLAATDGEEEINLDELLKRADQALYQAKQAGRNRVCLYRPEI